MIAGQNIFFYPGTYIEQGGYLYGYIAPEGPWCQSPAMPAVVSGVNAALHGTEQSYYRIYPNPTTGRFTIEWNENTTGENSTVEIYDMNGRNIVSEETAGERIHEFSLSGKPAGIYLIREISEGHYGTSRIIKQD
jgi:hypothetical protein